MTSLPPHAAPPEPPVVRRRLDQVVGRMRLLYLLAGCSRVVALTLAAAVGLYVADRFLDLPTAVRGVALLGVAVGLGLQAWRRVLRPLVVGVSRLEAARLVEDGIPGFEGRLVSALQLGDGPDGSFTHRVADEAAKACEANDLRRVLTAKPSLMELLRASGAALVVLLLVVLAQPELGVFADRLALRDVPWPRDTTLDLRLPERSPVHVLLLDGTVVASRGGVVNVSAGHVGVRPERVELVVEGAAGDRTGTMTPDATGRWQGHLTVEAGDTAIRVRGGDDPGDDNRLALSVIEPPRLDAPAFTLTFPGYLDRAPETVGPEGLSVPEGTAIAVEGRPTGPTTEAELQLLARAEPVPLEVVEDAQGPLVRGSFVADESDSLSVVLTGAHGLATPDPSHHPLVVREDRPPALRVYAPPRSDVKVTAAALVPFAVVAEDDHGIASVVLDPEAGSPRPFQQDAAQPRQHRALLDVRELGLTGTFAYALEAVDARQLPGKGPQSARAEGRRVDIVEDSEVQRLLADRQLRLKESIQALRERQLRASETLLDLMAEEPEDLDGELVAAAVAQSQVSTRLSREARELCGILEETITNRLDPGPGAEAVLERRLEDWFAQPVDEPFVAGPWRALAADYADGRYGRLDLVGRLLDMAGMALTLSEDLSPAAHDALVAARQSPGSTRYQAARDAQARVEDMLDRLLGRMDEWEDYQEVLSLVKSLIDDQRSLRDRTEEALKASGGN